MDNASFHRNRVLEDIFEGAGIELRFVPPYSPEYNPIETAFAWVKAHVRRTPTESIRDIPAATFTALNAVSGDLAKAWMRHSNYVVQ
jgi:transposase